MSKTIDKEFFIVYKIEPLEPFDSAIGVDNLALIFGRTKSSILKSLKKKYILYNNEKYEIIRESDLQSRKQVK